MDISQYHALPAIGKSDLDLVHRSPLHYWAARLDPNRVEPEPTPAMVWGTSVHTAVLEHERFEVDYAEGPEDLRSKANKERRLDLLSEGYIVLKPHEMESVQRIRDAVYAHPPARYLLNGAEVEQTVQWQDRWTKLDCKARPDVVNRAERILIDLKTTREASPEGFRREAYKHRYHVQAAWYSRGYEISTGETPAAFLFIAVETEWPHPVSVYVADEEMLRLGAEEADKDLQTLASCLERDHWPAYSEEIQLLSLPPYAKRRD